MFFSCSWMYFSSLGILIIPCMIKLQGMFTSYVLFFVVLFKLLFSSVPENLYRSSTIPCMSYILKPIVFSLYYFLST